MFGPGRLGPADLFIELCVKGCSKVHALGWWAGVPCGLTTPPDVSRVSACYMVCVLRCVLLGMQLQL